MLARMRTGELVQTPDIARAQRIPRRFLEVILLQLRRSGIVHNIRGPDGGYTLMKPATKISLADVIRASDGPVASLPCTGTGTSDRCEDCMEGESCQIRQILGEVHGAALGILERTSLAETASLFYGLESR